MAEDIVHRKKMYSLVSDWQSSGLNQTDFCNQHGISIRVFYYWKEKYLFEKEGIIRKKKTRNSGRFKKIVREEIIEEQPSETLPSLKITYPNGIKLEVHNSIDSTILEKIIEFTCSA